MVAFFYECIVGVTFTLYACNVWVRLRSPTKLCLFAVGERSRTYGYLFFAVGERSRTYRFPLLRGR